MQLVKKEVFPETAKLRKLSNVLPSRTKKQLYNALVHIAPPRLLLSCMAGMLNGSETDAGEGAEISHATHTATRQEPGWMTFEEKCQG